eukprot:scaffold44046_cov26-Tisochrysis_lutea.AAC.1
MGRLEALKRFSKNFLEINKYLVRANGTRPRVGFGNGKGKHMTGNRVHPDAQGDEQGGAPGGGNLISHEGGWK